MTAGRPPVAIVQDHLVQRGGAERVLGVLGEAFPGAPVHVGFLLADHVDAALLRLDLRPLPLDRVRPLARRHRLALPLLPLAFGALRVDADVTVCASSGWAAGCRASGAKVVYHHALARWVHEAGAYGAGAAGLAARALRPALARWDAAAVRSADRHLAPSAAVARALAEVHGVEAEVLHPPSTLDPVGPEAAPAGAGDLEPGFWLVPCRLLPYKRIDLVLAAADVAGLRVVVAGGGPDAARLAALAPQSARLLGPVDDDGLRWLHRRAAGVVTAAPEPFGLVPVEAAAFGRVAVAPAAGGAVETVLDGVTGVLADLDADGGADPLAALVGALRRAAALAPHLDVAAAAAHAATFGPAPFVARLRAVVAEVAEEGAGSRRR